MVLLNALSYKLPGFHPAAIIITNYIVILLPLVAYTLIGIAARSLSSTIQTVFSIHKARLTIILLAIAGILYGYLTLRRFDLTGFSSTHNAYYLPLWIVTLTIIVPSLYAWFTGLLAASEILVFSKKIRGVVYKQALQLLVGSTVTVIGSLVALQYINSIAPRAGYMILDYKIVLVSLFRLCAALGFFVLAIGARKLQKIEEV